MHRWLLCSVALHAALALLLVAGTRLLPGRSLKSPSVLAEVELVEQDTPAVGSQAAPAAASESAAKPVAAPAYPGQPSAAPPPAMLTAQPAPAADAEAMQPAEPAATFVRIGEPGSTGTGLVSGSQVISAALDQAVRNLPPAYPRQAVEEGEQGSVILKVHIATDGSVTGVDIFRTSSYGLLDAAARRAVEGWHFVPAHAAGRPVSSTMLLKIRFVLTNPEGSQ